MKIKNVFTIIITVIFFAGMTVLTFSARAIHNASLPKVVCKKLSYESFPFEYTDENGVIYTGMRASAAIETRCLEDNIYVLYEYEKNGETRYFVRLTTIEAGEEYGDFTKVLSGLASGQKYVSECDGELYDGCEVFVVKNNKL